VENPLEKVAVALALPLHLEFVHTPRGPGVYRRIDIAECPLVRRQLPVRVHVPLARHEQQLFLSELGIDESQSDTVKCQIPGRVPRIFPLVRHRYDIRVVQMAPFVVAAVQTLFWRLRTGRIAFEPAIKIVIVNLFAP
jgi:hypothetical protein